MVSVQGDGWIGRSQVFAAVVARGSVCSFLGEMKVDVEMTLWGLVLVFDPASPKQPARATLIP
jgi:hypothetical protein